MFHADSAICTANDHLPSRCLVAEDLSLVVLIFPTWTLLAFSLVSLHLKLVLLAVFALPTRQVSARVAYRADSFIRTLAALSAADAAVGTFDAARLVGPILVPAFGAVRAGTFLRCIDEAARRAVGAEACE